MKRNSEEDEKKQLELYKKLHKITVDYSPAQVLSASVALFSMVAGESGLSKEQAVSLVTNTVEKFAPHFLRKKKKIMLANTSLILGIVIGVAFCLLGSWVDHTVDYEVHVPEVENQREQQRAEDNSKDGGCTIYTDDRGNTHTFINGGECA